MFWSTGSRAEFRSAGRRKPHADARGFTLVEIIVAFTIAAALLTALLRSFSAGVGSSTRAETYGTAIILAQTTLQSLGAVVPLHDGADIDRREGPFHVVATTRRYGSGDASAQQGPQVVPFELTVTVEWQEGANGRSVELRTLRLGSQG